MKYISVSSKLNIAIISIAIISLFIGAFVLNNYAHETKLEIYNQARIELVENTKDKIDAKMKVGITNAISIANDDRIKKAFKTGERDCAIRSLQDISEKMKMHTEFKNIKIHLHTKDNHSFLRNWKLDKYGDDLSSFRAAVVEVNKTKTPIATFEPGRAGLLLRGITPIIDRDGVHYGSLEFIQGINSVAKEFDKSKIGFVLLMDNSVKQDISTGKDFSFNKSDIYKDYIISQKFINQEFIQDANTISLQQMFAQGYVVSGKYFYTYVDIKDFHEKKLGIALLGKPLSQVNRAVEGAETLIKLSLWGIFGMIVVIVLVIVIAVRKLVTRPLKEFEQGLQNFFEFLQGKREYTESIDLDTNDEFGKMAHSLRENIAVSAKLHEDIRDLNTNLEQKIEEKTKNVITLLDNAGQGFLRFNSELIVDNEYSKECIKLLGDNLGGQNISNVLFQNSNKKTFFESTIKDAMVESEPIVRNSLISLLPNEIILNRRALKLEFKILDTYNVMAIITNISAQKKLEKKVKEEQSRLKMVVEIVSESDIFYDTKDDYEEFIKSYRDLVKTNKTSLNNINEIYRVVHTFKGAFSQLYMQNVVNFLHQLENKISAMIKEHVHTNEMLLELLDSCDFRESLDKELDTIREILGDDFVNSQNYLKINYKEIKTLQKKIFSVFKEQNNITPETEEIITQVSSLSDQKLINVLKPYGNVVKQLSQKLEKEVYDLEIIGSENVMVAEKCKPFFKSLIHVFRNSVDHGIESPDVRVEHDKDEIGTISCNFEENKQDITIVISDDGAGIDKEKVVQKAIQMGIITHGIAKELSEQEIYQLIFHEQFSLKEEISEISGRGVGMNAVKSEIDKLNGTITIKSEKGKGTTFIFTLPKQKGEIL